MRIIIIILILSIQAFANAQGWEESYDPNTEILIQGKVVDIVLRIRGPVVIEVLKKDRIYSIVTAPAWYLDQEKIKISIGDEVVVRGAKFFSRKGEIFFIAREIQNLSTSKTYLFRDEFMKPCWRGRGHHH